MSRPVMIVVVGTSPGDRTFASLRELISTGIGLGEPPAIRLEVLRETDSEPLRIRLRRVQADLAVLLLRPIAGVLEESTLRVVKDACVECPVLAVVPEMLPKPLLDLFNAGASDFVMAPLRRGDLLARLARLLELRHPEVDLVDRLKQVMASCKIVGRSPSLLAQLRRLPLVAECDATVLISGETGTGKELFARAIHYLSRRATGPFVAVNCGAIPTELIENELFGHESGAYTTAVASHTGLLREADGGSLFLDEIDTLPLSLQVKLLRFLQDKEYRPLGSGRVCHADVRVMAASNLSLEAATSAGRFRSDLFYRLNVLAVELPPLRQRREDIPLLTRHFVERYSAEFGQTAKELSPGAMQSLFTHDWPGNVRELENLIQRAVLLCETKIIDSQQLFPGAQSNESEGGTFHEQKAKAVREFERNYLTEMLRGHDGNISASARAAGKNRRAFWELLRKHELLHARHLPASPRAVQSVIG